MTQINLCVLGVHPGPIPTSVYGRARAREEKIDDLLREYGRGLKYLRKFSTDFSENLRIPSPIIPPNSHQGGSKVLLRVQSYLKESPGVLN